MSDEETRAQLWRDNERARAQAVRTAEARLAGDPARARAVREAFDPLRPVNRDGVAIVGFEYLAPPTLTDEVIDTRDLAQGLRSEDCP